MKIKFEKETLLNTLGVASRFTSNKTIVAPILQGCLLQFDGEFLHVYATNLTMFFHTKVPMKTEEKQSYVVEAKKIIEFLSLLSEVSVELEFDKGLHISSKKVKGTFPLMDPKDFPMPPEVGEKKSMVPADFFINSVPFVQFSASHDETRPAFTAIFISPKDKQTQLVSTDGFRLSLVNYEGSILNSPTLVPANFLAEVSRYIGKEKEVQISRSDKEKTLYVKVGDNEFYTRLIEGEFPPFEKVIPPSIVTTITCEKEELVRAIKLISVFARDVSNIVVFEVKPEGLFIVPKTENEEQNKVAIEGEVKGEPMRIAFNFKFVLDFLSIAKKKNVTIELLRSDAPAVFKEEKSSNAVHIIMPVRIQA